MHLKKTRKSRKEDTCTQISAKINAKRVSCWFVGAWMKTSLQSYILYEEQRANEPLGIRRPLLNIWNIYAALNFFYIFPLIFYARNEFCLPEQFSSLSWIPFENVGILWLWCCVSIRSLLQTQTGHVKEVLWLVLKAFKSSASVMFPCAGNVNEELRLRCDGENFKSQNSSKPQTLPWLPLDQNYLCWTVKGNKLSSHRLF